MATKNFRSTVLEPTSEFAYGDKLRFTALSSINQVFKRSFSEVTIGVDGVYDIDLQYGKYRIDYKPYEGVWALFANVEVGAETTATTLQDLAMTSNPVTDDTILALQAILAETKLNAENAEKSSSDSIEAAAEAAKDRDEIEDLMLRAMTTADVEAVRTSNKALYAASGVDTWGTRGSTPVNPLKNGLNCTTTANTLLFDGKFHISGLIFDIPDNSPINFDTASDGKTTYNKITGVVTKHVTVQAAFAAALADAAVEVVTDRTDVYALEVYLRDITEADPMVYPRGYIHAQDVDINGATTSLDTIRPDSYYAQFIGQTDVVRGRSVNWFTATNDEKLAILSVADRHGYIHYDPKTGAWRQWCVRVIESNGDGNGDWFIVSPQLNILVFAETGAGKTTAQGITNTRHDGDSFYAGTHFSSYNRYPERGVFTAYSKNINVAVNNECYMLTLGTVARLNSGVWHPSHNPMGCYKYTAANLNPLGQGITSTEECFLPESIGTQSARPDGRLPNLIYASGYGGVCRDMRYSAYHTTKEESDTQKWNTYTGRYRGYEKRVFTKIRKLVAANRDTDEWTNGLAVYDSKNCALDFAASGDVLTPYSTLYAVSLDGGVILKSNSAGNRISSKLARDFTAIDINGFLPENTRDKFEYPNEFYLIETSELYQSVGGEFSHIDVAGSPSDILDNPDLSNGWEGGWIASSTSGLETHALSRLSLSDVSVTSCTNNVWVGTVTSSDFNTVTNSLLMGVIPDGYVSLWQYTASAKQTKAVVNTQVYGGHSGVGELLRYGGYNAEEWGCVFAESVLSKVCTSDVSGTGTSSLSLTGLTINPYGFINPRANIDNTVHTPIDLPASNNDSVGLKALDYRVTTYNQCSLNFAVTELRWGEKDGVPSWGDDDQIHTVDNESTLVDTNGNVVKVATHTLAEPIGWVK